MLDRKLYVNEFFMNTKKEARLVNTLNKIEVNVTKFKYCNFSYR